MLTDLEKEILKNTDKEWRYITRDVFGELVIFTQSPARYNYYGEWCCCGCDDYIDDKCCEFAFKHLFKSIQWTDEKPLEFRNEKGEFLL